jgi:hypothetical protein
MAPCGEQFLFIEIELRRHMPTAGADELDAVMPASLGAALSLGSRGKEGAGTTGFLPEPWAQRYLFLYRTDILIWTGRSLLRLARQSAYYQCSLHSTGDSIKQDGGQFIDPRLFNSRAE